MSYRNRLRVSNILVFYAIKYGTIFFFSKEYFFKTCKSKMLCPKSGRLFKKNYKVKERKKFNHNKIIKNNKNLVNNY